MGKGAASQRGRREWKLKSHGARERDPARAPGSQRRENSVSLRAAARATRSGSGGWRQRQLHSSVVVLHVVPVGQPAPVKQMQWPSLEHAVEGQTVASSAGEHCPHAAVPLSTLQSGNSGFVQPFAPASAPSVHTTHVSKAVSLGVRSHEPVAQVGCAASHWTHLSKFLLPAATSHTDVVPVHADVSFAAHCTHP